MPDYLAGLVKVAAVRVHVEQGGPASVVAAGDEWIAQDEIKRVRSETTQGETGDPVTVTLISLKGGGELRTEADPETELLPLAESARADAATKQFQPLVDQLEARAQQTDA